VKPIFTEEKKEHSMTGAGHCAGRGRKARGSGARIGKGGKDLNQGISRGETVMGGYSMQTGDQRGTLKISSNISGKRTQRALSARAIRGGQRTIEKGSKNRCVRGS